MDKLDKLISDTLDDEDREILDKIGREQSLPNLAVGLLRGRIGWLNILTLIWGLGFFCAGLYAARQAFILVELIEVVRWGLSAVVLLLAALFARVILIEGMHANRVLHAVKHMEMEIALLAGKGGNVRHGA